VQRQVRDGLLPSSVLHSKVECVFCSACRGSVLCSRVAAALPARLNRIKEVVSVGVMLFSRRRCILCTWKATCDPSTTHGSVCALRA
jgi:hypothetical protein